MGFLLRVLGLVAFILCLEKPAQAANQPWCIFKTYTDGYADCRYATAAMLGGPARHRRILRTESVPV
jgi:hypothetical protein